MHSTISFTVKSVMLFFSKSLVYLYLFFLLAKFMENKKVPILPKKPLRSTLSNPQKVHHENSLLKPCNENSSLVKPKPPARPPAPLKPPPRPVHNNEVSSTNNNRSPLKSYDLTNSNNGVNTSNKKLLERPLPPPPMQSNLCKLKSMSAPNLFVDDNVISRPHAQSMFIDETIYEDTDQCDGSVGNKMKRFVAKTRSNFSGNRLKKEYNYAKSGVKKGIRKWYSFGESDIPTTHISAKEDTLPESPKLNIASNRKNILNRFSELHTDLDTQLFECFLVVSLKDSSGKLVPEITFQFPPTFNNENFDEKLLSIPQFCFPDTSLTYKHGETFSFVLTSDSGERRYGFCRMINSTGMAQPEVYCIISPYGLFALYSQILEEVENQRKYSSTAVFSLLKTTLSKPLPQPTESVIISFFSSGSASSMRQITLTRPGDSSIHEHVDLKLLFDTVKTNVILELLTCLLIESKVILCSKSLSLLTSCCHSLISLMYPFEWEHTYIPVLPTNLIDIVCLPSPYLLGVLPSSVSEIQDLPIEEVYILDLDSGEKILHPDLKCEIPKNMCQEISKSLNQVFDLTGYDGIDMVDGEEKAQNEIICKIFVQIYIQLIGHFESFYIKDEDGTDIIDYRPFYKASESKEKKHFLKAFVVTQAFQKFTSSRKRDGPSHDLFESTFSAWKESGGGTVYFNKNIDSMLMLFKRKFRK